LAVARLFANSTPKNPIRRELLNGLFVLAVASLLSAAFSAFEVSFNALLWVPILMGIAIRGPLSGCRPTLESCGAAPVTNGLKSDK
jgi:hypothetical protein